MKTTIYSGGKLASSVMDVLWASEGVQIEDTEQERERRMIEKQIIGVLNGPSVRGPSGPARTIGADWTT